MADYCSIQNVKDYLQISGTTYDNLLNTLVSSASKIVDNFCEHPLSFNQETVTEIVRARVDNDGNLVAAIGKPKLVSVSALAYRTNPSNSVALDVALIEIDGFCLRHMGGNLGFVRNKPLKATVTYVGGYSPLPQDLVHATIVLAARIFKAKDAGFADVVGVAELGTLQYSKVMPREIQKALQNLKRVAPW